ncbi:hypothetical protein [Chitinophaga sp. XS-30]|uniref:hypothetical protein n=1 Tax=Chitinophaga sp. XS-30 TaxID=2604421 RepID=UPI0011DD2111|nr:hypothetical protein [Chitinophaga sp. XS-30]QEH43594.1 hypothetical protein FW415_23160 [Chitinophaga sp. XS-30]
MNMAEINSIVVVFIGMVLFVVIQIIIIRWVLRINDIVFYLDKINEKLYKLLDEKGLNEK